MLKNKCKFITDEECEMISKIASDIDSGNHLIRPRSKDYWDFFYMMVRARTNEIHGHATHKQAEMCEYERQCSDYSYWKKLPTEKKLFVEA